MKSSIYGCAVWLAFMLTANAAEETSTFVSPKCDAAKVKVLGAEGVSKVTPGTWPGSYQITVDTAKISSAEMMKKLYEAGCM